MSPFFSIVTCTLNSAQFFGDAIASIEAQEFRDFEHVVVDGHSTDGTLDQLGTAGHPVKIVSRPPRGIADAMNAGTAAATGSVILHLHSDDYLAHPRVLARVAAEFAKRNCSWLYGRTLSDVDGGWTPEAEHFAPYSYRRLLRGNIVPHPATFVRRELLAGCGGFDPSLRYAMDYDLWLRLGRTHAPARLVEFLAVFRAHSASATHANRLASFDEDHRVRRRHIGWQRPLTRLQHELIHLRRRRRLQRHLAET